MSQNCQFDEFIQQDFVNNIYPQLINFLENEKEINTCFFNGNYEKVNKGSQAEVFIINNTYVIKFINKLNKNFLKLKREKILELNQKHIFNLAPSYIINLFNSYNYSNDLIERAKRKNPKISYYNLDTIVLQPYFESFFDILKKYQQLVSGSQMHLDITNTDNIGISSKSKIIYFDW